jgi:hypothetical protein
MFGPVVASGETGQKAPASPAFKPEMFGIEANSEIENRLRI